MKFLRAFWVVLTIAGSTTVAWAQNVAIITPQEGQDVRGEITVKYDGIPTGGYAVIKLDNQLVTATAQSSIQLDTIADRTLFPNGDGTYKLEVVVLNSGGKRVGSSSVSFNVANTRVAGNEVESVRLVVWNRSDRSSGEVLRYRVFAESKGPTTQDMSGKGAEGGGGGGGEGGGGIVYLEAPLDWQVSALMRRIVRDTDLLEGSANIRTIVQEAFERPREAPTNEDPNAGKKRRRGAGTITMLAPWAVNWTQAAETGQYFVKMARANGTEINATRKANTIALADLLPTFPDAPVRPGSTWETNMTILGELSSRTPINVRAPVTFTAFENLTTPAGENRRCAKLESRFRLPENLAKKIAVGLENQSSRSAGDATTASSGAGAGVVTAPGQAAGGTGIMVEDDIELARSDVARVLWFDIERSRVLRSEDTIRTYYETYVEAEGGATNAAGGTDAAAAAEPKRINYNLTVTTWLDDTVPRPTTKLTGGAGTAHSRDNVQDPPLTRITNPGQ